MFQYEIIDGLRAELGPQIGFNISKKYKYEYSSNVPGYEEGSGSTDAEVKSVDFGLNIGAGYELSNGLNFSARYNFGLSNINDEGGNLKIKNSVFSVGLGYTFLK